jgi:hypothetical protein
MVMMLLVTVIDWLRLMGGNRLNLERCIVWDILGERLQGLYTNSRLARGRVVGRGRGRKRKRKRKRLRRRVLN